MLRSKTVPPLQTLVRCSTRVAPMPSKIVVRFFLPHFVRNATGFLTNNLASSKVSFKIIFLEYLASYRFSTKAK